MPLLAPSFRECPHIPSITRREIKGAPQAVSVRQVSAKRIEAIREQAKQMEADSRRFYLQAATGTRDAEVRKLLGDLAEAEAGHDKRADGG